MSIMETTIKNFISKILKKKWVRIFLGLIAILLVVSSVLKALTPEPVPIETLVTSDLSYSPKVKFNDITLDIPSKITVYQNIQDKSVKNNKLKQQFIDELNLTVHKSDQYWRNEAGTILMEVNSKNETFLSFFDGPDLFPAKGIPENRQAAVTNVQNILGKLGFTQNVHISDPKYVFLENRIEAVDSAADANGLEFSVQFFIDNIPYFSNNTSDPPAMVWTDLSGKVLKITFYPIANTFEKIETYNSLSLGQIEHQVELKNFSFIDVRISNSYIEYTPNLDSVVFDKAQLEYRKNEQNGYIVPYVRFFGRENRGEDIVDVEIVSPAVKVQ